MRTHSEGGSAPGGDANRNERNEGENIFTESSRSDSAPGRGFFNGDHILNVFESTSLQPNHKKFMEAIKSNLESDFGDQVEFLNISAGVAAQGFVAKDVQTSTPTVLIFGFARSIPEQANGYPKIMVNRVLEQAVIDRVGKDVRILNTILVTEEDLERVDRWSLHVASLYRLVLGKEYRRVDHRAFTDGAELVVSTNPEEVREAVAAYFPHAVKPPIDHGIVVYRQTGRRDDDESLFGDRRVDSNRRFLFAAGGIADFEGPKQCGDDRRLRMAVNARMTALVSPLPYLGMQALALPLYAYHCVRSGRWLDPYHNILADRSASSNSLNIGYLAPPTENDGRFWAPETESQFRDFVLDNLISPAYTCIDTVLGQARIPDMIGFVRNDRGNAHGMLERISRFYNKDLDASYISTPWEVINEDMHGYFGSEDRRRDTRHRNYVELMSDSNGSMDEDGRLRNILLRYNDIERRANALRKLPGNTTFLNMCYTTMINPETVDYIIDLTKNIRMFAPGGGQYDDYSVGTASDWNRYSSTAYSRRSRSAEFGEGLFSSKLF